MKPVPVSAQMSLQRAQHSVVLEEPYRIGLDMLRSIMSFIQMFTHTNTLSLHNGCMQEAGTSGTKKKFTEAGDAHLAAIRGVLGHPENQNVTGLIRKHHLYPLLICPQHKTLVPIHSGLPVLE